MTSSRTIKNPLNAILVPLIFCALVFAGGCAARNEGADVPRGMGSLLVRSVPEGGAIIFNGNPRGAAYSQKPIEIKGVAYGRHSIRVEFPGYVAQVLEVDVREKKVPIRIKLTKDGAGSLVVGSNPPGAEVFVNSRYYGNAAPTLRITNLSAGAYSMWLRLPGYRMERHNVVVDRRLEYRYLIALDKEP